MKTFVKKFEKNADFEKTSVDELLKMLQKEVDVLKKNKNDKKISNHQLIDVQVLLFQLANRYNTNLDLEWNNHWKNSRKYIKK